MKISRDQLKKIIAEEIQKVLKEQEQAQTSSWQQKSKEKPRWFQPNRPLEIKYKSEAKKLETKIKKANPLQTSKTKRVWNFVARLPSIIPLWRKVKIGWLLIKCMWYMATDQHPDIIFKSIRSEIQQWDFVLKQKKIFELQREVLKFLCKHVFSEKERNTSKWCALVVDLGKEDKDVYT